MIIRMYSVYDSYNEKYSIPFGLGDSFEDEYGNGIRRFMYMFVANPEMRMRAADYELRCVGDYDDDCGILQVQMEDPKDFDFVVKGTEIVKYLDNPNVSTNQILNEIEDERRKEIV